MQSSVLMLHFSSLFVHIINHTNTAWQLSLLSHVGAEFLVEDVLF